MKRPAINKTPVPAGGRGWSGPNQQMYVWDGQPMRPPRKGERFLSGAKVEAHLCTMEGVTTPYYIAVPVPNNGQNLN